jgi:hypothetical protein
MKILLKKNADLAVEGRWDLDYHLPPEGIRAFPQERLTKVSNLAHVSKIQRDPTLRPDETFLYVDIASIDVSSGTITNPQELTGSEAPSRARKVIRTSDVLVSTVRPTRGAIAVVPESLDNQICSTGFTVLRCKEGVDPYFLQFVLRLASTAEQFRKFSTGSSYPAILDGDVMKTLVPGGTSEERNFIARSTVAALEERNELVKAANEELNEALRAAESALTRSVEDEDWLRQVSDYPFQETQGGRILAPEHPQLELG